MISAALVRPDVTLVDKYTAESGPVMINGMQALVRLTLDQRRLDQRRGHNTAVYVSGYAGSPLGGYDRELQRARDHLGPAGVVFRPGLNEELAATAVAGTQLLGQLEARRHDGVAGLWFGKSPGFDRAADAIRHGTLSGTAPLGGVVALIGDDPSSKSSTVPSSSEPMCRSLFMPLLAPGTVRELLTHGLHAVAMSRHAGLWCGMKVVADIADASSIVQLDGLLDAIPELPLREPGAPPVLLPPTNLDAEHDLMTARLARAIEYARLARLNRITFEPRRPRLAVVAAGMGFQALLRALENLGLDGDAREALGLRLVQLGMPWPLEGENLRALLEGVETVLIVEDKLPFVETMAKEALYRQPNAPVVIGKEDGDGTKLLPTRSTLGADDVARALARAIGEQALPEGALRRLERIEERTGDTRQLEALPMRTPYFCSGCPHNVSTRAEANQLVGVGIGCHVMVAIDGGDRRGHLLGMTQMGGEGMQWLGLEPFTDEPHFIQNIGDGTFHHSGSLAVRAATAAGARVTYKLLYNDAVAMTGGQDPEGRMSVPALTRWLALEGVKRILVTTPEPARYRGVMLDPIASVRHRDELRAAQRELAEVNGVTVLIHDDRCATEKRRLRKRGKLKAPAERVWINERVCEGCGDCAEQSTCLSVLPVDTEFGHKRQIHQSSCNQDFTCVKGDCPSFLLVTPNGDAKPPKPGLPALPVELPEPTPRVPRQALLRMPGVGGTGVVTVSAIVQMAAHLDGRFAAGLEQIGLAQKGGPVISDIRLADAPVEGQLRASAGSVDVLLGFDLLGAASSDTLAVADPARTVAVVNTAKMPTAAMVTDTTLSFPAARLPMSRIEAATRYDEALFVDAEELAERLFADHLPANMVLLGAAFQHGCVPLSVAAIEHAIELNGASVQANLAAFRWGRAWVVDSDAVRVAVAASQTPRALDAHAHRLLEPIAEGELRRLVDVRVHELIAYQNAAYARRYVEDVLRVATVARERVGEGGAAIAEGYARSLHKLMAYKDEYEVARLHLDANERARREHALGAGARVQVLLHPPLLRALGLKRKLRLGPWFVHVLRVLYSMRCLRGTRLDPFGAAHVRRVERELIQEYRGLVDEAIGRLDAGNFATVAELVALPDVVRGYEEIKLRNVERFRARARQLVGRLSAGQPSTLALPLTRVGGDS